jgi:hypothetical protein
MLPGIHPPRASGKKPYWPWVLIFGAGFVLLAIVLSLTATGGDDEYHADNRYEAIAQCEAAIMDRLKAPSTASFDSTASGGGTWTVTGTVDAENSFGATIRSSYQCSVIINEANDTARVRVDHLD